MNLIPVVEMSQIGAARRRAVAQSQAHGLDQEAQDRVALIVTEMASNLVRHATDGEILFSSPSEHHETGFTLVALDGGPGLASVEQALEDGFTTDKGEGRGIGAGLGAIKRHADRFDIYSDPGGTVVTAVIGGEKNSDWTIEAGGMIVPKPGFDEGGDAWGIRHGTDKTLILMMDILGHGSAAASAGREGLAAFHDGPMSPLETTEEKISAALQGGRGAAMMLVEISRDEAPMRSVGLGNIRGEIVSGNERRSILSSPGVAGATTRRPRPVEHEFPKEATLVMSSDGLGNQTARPGSPNATESPALYARDPLTIASLLYRRRRRQTDDSGVVVARRRS